jgi:hypothetical protein
MADRYARTGVGLCRLAGSTTEILHRDWPHDTRTPGFLYRDSNDTSRRPPTPGGRRITDTSHPGRVGRIGSSNSDGSPENTSWSWWASDFCTRHPTK